METLRIRVFMKYRWFLSKKNLTYIGAVLTAIYLLYSLFNSSKTIPYDQDEIHTFYETESFEHIKHFDFTSEYWKRPIHFDHPPVSRYLYGGYLTMLLGDFSHVREDLIDRYGQWVFGKFAAQSDYYVSPFPLYINHMRYISVLLTWLTILMVAFICLYLTNSFFSLAIALLLVQNNLFTHMMLKSLPDSPYIFFSSLALISFIYFMWKKSRKGLLLSGIAGGLSLASKLTGVIYFIVVSAYCLIDIDISQFKLREQIYTIIGILFVGLTVWILINPSLYNDPYATTLKYFSVRETILHLQVLDTQNKHVVLHTLNDRLLAMWHVFFSGKDPNSGSITKYPFINFSSFFLGLYFLLKKSLIKQSIIERLVLLYLVITFAYIFPFLELNWPRYYLPFVIPILLTSMYGFWGLYKAILYTIPRMTSNRV